MAKSTQKNLQWIYNILDEKSEKENIILNHGVGDEGFMLVRDYSFKPNSKINNLHIIALVKDRSLKSLRDINQKHLGIL
ncbi:MAG: hypothetical protein LH629_02270 [Ignavibacteria bacterium]|nr:hypothetical protein [Ignavibacteria bacterium]